MYVLRRLSHLKHRLAVGAVAALCLGALQVAHASKLPDFSRSGVNYTGKSATFGMTGGSTSYGSTLPISPPLGGGWQFAGNYGIPASSTGPTMTMSANGNVFFAGTKYPFQAAYQVPSSAVTDALKAMGAVGGVLGGPLGLGLAIVGGGMPYVLDWLQRSGGRVNADGSIERSDPAYCTVGPCYEYQGGNDGVWYSTLLQAAQNSVGQKNGCTGTSIYPHHVGTVTAPNSYTYYWAYCNDSYVWPDAEGTGTVSTRSVEPSAAPWLPSSMNDIAPYMDPTTRDPRVIQEVLNKGGSINMPNPTVTGPSSIEGPSKETPNPDGSKTVEKTTYNFTTNGDTITNTTNNTTTTIYNADNSVRNVTNTTNAPTENEEIPKDCDKDSSTVGCSKLETPEDKPLPKADKNITYTAESWFGGGSCPADKIVTVGGQQVKAWDWTVSCDYLVTYGRPLILAAAAFMALMILAPGVKE